MVRLTKAQLDKKVKFIQDYVKAKNAADGAAMDSNANVSTKNIATLAAELNKDINIQVNRALVYDKIEQFWGKDTADEYIRQLEDHEIYTHDETALMSYTYSFGESVSVVKGGKKLLISLEELYALCDSNEILEDAELGVWVKYPDDLFIEDFNGLTRVTRLVKKTRHRDMYRVKLQYGEDIIVTDNHPLIVDKQDINKTINAVDSLGELQYKRSLSFESKTFYVDLFEQFPDKFDNLDEFLLLKTSRGQKVDGIKRRINLSAELGYALGFFIAEGYFSSDIKRGIDNPMISFIQNDPEVLRKISEYIYKETGIIGKVVARAKRDIDVNQSYRLIYNSRSLFILFRDFFGIRAYSYNKNLPFNILETNSEFVNGLLSGIIDGDGSVARDQISIRLASRSCISQLMILLRMFGIRVATTFLDVVIEKEKKDKIYSTFPISGVAFNKSDELDFRLSFKCRDVVCNPNTRYNSDFSKIIKVQKIQNEKFLDKPIYDITTDTRSFICNNILVHNCASISMYPYLLDGLSAFGGETKAPKHLSSFNGGLVNLIFAVSSQLSGACAVVEYLMYFDYFAKKDYGENYLETHEKVIAQELQQFIYAINQPASARSFQSAFTNISIYDRPYFESIFKDFVFPDFTRPDYNSVAKLQKFFMSWFNKERTKAILTFPVVTAACLNDGETMVDKDFQDFLAKEYSEGNAFFTYTSQSADALSSCCRLKNVIESEDNQFSYSLGAGGVATGSKNVITINVNRLVQEGRDIVEQVKKLHKYQMGFEALFQDYFNKDMMPLYSGGFISLDKQYLTIGLNGIVEAAEFLGYEISNNEPYKNWVRDLLKSVSDANKEASKLYGVKFNTEIVPAENLGVKFAAWDKKDGLVVPRDCYNSYFYKVEDDDISVLDKFILHGREVAQYLDGGSAYHCNLEEYPDKEQFKKLLDVAARTGCEYFCFNIKITICNSCGNIDKRTHQKCPKCGSRDIDYGTRIIGYLKRISCFSEGRRKEAALRHYEVADSVTK